MNAMTSTSRARSALCFGVLLTTGCASEGTLATTPLDSPETAASVAAGPGRLALPVDDLLVPAEPMDPALRAAAVRSIMADADARFDVSAVGSDRVEATHPDQDLRVTFDGEAITLADRAGALPVHVGLQRVDGRAPARAEVHAEGNRVELRRGPLTEWYLHGPLGVEQGFTLESAPAGAGSELTLEMAVDCAGYEVTPTGDRGLRLTSGDRSITVADLFAYDATGRELPARMAWEHESLAIVVNVEGASYPVVIDPTWSQQQKLAPGDAGDNVGLSVSLSGDTALIGAHFDDRAGMRAGAAYVFVRSGTTWTQQARLVSSDLAAGDEFGRAVALSRDTAVVAAWRDDDGAADTGSVYVFVRSGTTWTQQAKLRAADAATQDFFGLSVAVEGDTALVSSYDDDGGSESGAVYAFVRSGTTWTQQAKLRAADAAASDLFGATLALSGETALIGANFAHAPAVDSGAAYIFVRSGTTWSQQAKLAPPAPLAGDEFGDAVSLAGDTAVVAASRRDVMFPNDGAVYVFQRTGTTWALQATLVASDPAADDRFGRAVAVSGNLVLVGAPLHDEPGAGNAGVVYSFLRTGTTWAQDARFVNPAPGFDDRFGFSVALGGNTGLVGAPFDDGATTGSAFVILRHICGDGVLEGSEQCDDGNTAAGDCCSATCTFEASTTVCRADVGVCDVAERCTGTSGTCPADAAEPEGTVCGAAPSGPCDAQDSCAGTTGATATCAARLQPATFVCRPAAMPCDAPETCSGTSTTCPADAIAMAGTVCRAAADACDAPETCNGTALSCPADADAPDGTACADMMTCNGAEVCMAGGCVDAPDVVCDDMNLCTADACAEPGGCAATPIAGCCNTAMDCPDDGDACTLAVCSGAGGTCSTTLDPSCVDSGMMMVEEDAGMVVGSDAGRRDAGSSTGPDTGSGSTDAGESPDAGGPPSMDGCACRVGTTSAPSRPLGVLFGLFGLVMVLRRRAARR